MRARCPTALLAAVVAVLAAVPVAAAQVEPPGTDDAGGVWNVLAAGQGGLANAVEVLAGQAGAPPPATFVNQLPMYTDLLRGAAGLTRERLTDYFKSAGFGVADSDVATRERPRPGVVILRDRRFRVPRVYGTTRSDTMFGAGYASAGDRLFLMDLFRHLGRGKLSEFAGEDFLDLDLEQLRGADYTEAELGTLVENGVQAAGSDGPALRRDLDDYSAGVNAYIRDAILNPLTKLPGEYAALGKLPQPWKPTDTAAAATLIAAMFGKGGGGEARAAAVLSAAEQRFGAERGRAVYEDLRRREDPEAPVTTTKRFPFAPAARVDRRAPARPDPGSFRATGPDAGVARARRAADGAPAHGLLDPRAFRALFEQKEHSHAYLIGRHASRSGTPLAIFGPQLGYYSPQVVSEIELHGPGIDVRGAAFPGAAFFVIMGRGRDFAWSATTAGGDDVDLFAERLCDPGGGEPTRESTHYVRDGRCIALGRREHVIRTTPNLNDPGAAPRTIRLQLERSVHGPIVGRATVGGRPVAFAEARSTWFHDLDSAVDFTRVNQGGVRSARDFNRVMGHSNLGFNWFYADRRDIAYVQAGWYPRRARGVDQDMPAWGTGRWDWQGFDATTKVSRRVPLSGLPQEINPKRGYLLNWNNKQAPGWRAADDKFNLSSIYRSLIPQTRIDRALAHGGKLSLVRLVQIMETSATVDLRGQEALPWMLRVIGRSGDPQVRELAGLLERWRKAGAHRRDLDGDNVLDASPAVVLMDVWWPRAVEGVFGPVLGGDLMARMRAVLGYGSAPGSGGSAFGGGWWGYLQKDLRSLLGAKVRGPLARRYCGKGSLTRCRAILERTLLDAAAAARGGTALDAVKRPATCAKGRPAPRPCDQIEFFTAGGISTPSIPWQNRPTFQQIAEIGEPRSVIAEIGER